MTNLTRTIAVFHTGGTIAMRQDDVTGGVTTQAGGGAANLGSEDLHLGDVVIKVVDNQVFNLPSPHISEHEMDVLSTAVTEAVRSGEFDGVVVTHGTDTLEETAYFLDLTVPTEIPVVVTGAMRSANEIGADGLHNYLSALKVAASEETRGAGVLVVLNEEIHAARNVTKTHTSNVATFQSPQFGPLGIVTKNGVSLRQRLTHRETFTPGEETRTVGLLKAYAGMDSAPFDAAAAAGPDGGPVDGLVVEALGAGNLPPRALPGLQRLLDRGVPVVLVSRCFNGITEDVYAYEGGGKHLAELGVIFSNGVNGPKARIKLLIALRSGASIEELRESFSR